MALTVSVPYTQRLSNMGPDMDAMDVDSDITEVIISNSKQSH